MARHPELLIPASSLEVLKTAVIFGADAVYIGGRITKNKRFPDKKEWYKELCESYRTCRQSQTKIPVYLQILPH